MRIPSNLICAVIVYNHKTALLRCQDGYTYSVVVKPDRVMLVRSTIEVRPRVKLPLVVRLAAVLQKLTDVSYDLEEAIDESKVNVPELVDVLI